MFEFKFFIQSLIRNGNKERARTIFYSSWQMLRFHYPNLSDDDLFQIISDKACPGLAVSTWRHGRTKRSVVRSISRTRSISIGARWIVSAARFRKERGMVFRIFCEFVDIIEGRSSVIERVNKLHSNSLNMFGDESIFKSASSVSSKFPNSGSWYFRVFARRNRFFSRKSPGRRNFSRNFFGGSFKAFPRRSFFWFSRWKLIFFYEGFFYQKWFIVF